jgi:hypothetical protein
MFRLGNGNGESVLPVEMQHHVNIRASVAHIHNPIQRHIEFFRQLLQPRHFAEASRRAHQALNFTTRTVAQLRSENVVLGQDTFKPSSGDWITSTAFSAFQRARHHVLQSEMRLSDLAKFAPWMVQKPVPQTDASLTLIVLSLPGITLLASWYSFKLNHLPVDPTDH